MTPWVAAAVQFMTLDDHLYFENSATDLQQQIVNQYGNTINYVSVKVKEIKFGNFALDNTFLYQKVSQQDAILNVPELVTRIRFITLITYLKKHCFTNWNN
jgi:hypothetical protein